MTRQMVPGEKPQKPFGGLMIIGEAPGRDEVRTSRPFCGPCGTELDWLLRELDIDRDTVYVTNVCKEWPVDAAGKTRKPDEREIEKWRPDLRREIAHIKPDVILALGKRCTWRAVGQALGRGYPEIKIVQAWHPGYTFRQRSKRPAWRDRIRQAL